MAVQWLIDQKLPEYNVVHIQGAMGSDAQIGRTKALDEQFAKGAMKCVIQQTATWDEATAKQIVESVINSARSSMLSMPRMTVWPRAQLQLWMKQVLPMVKTETSS